MKKLLLTGLIALVAGTAAEARTLTPGEALGRLGADRTAMGVLNGAAASNSRLLKTVRTSKGDAAVYLFGNMANKGYMLVSADDVAEPLLGYSHTPLPTDTAQMPPQLSWWLTEYAGEIEAAQQSGTSVSSTASFGLKAEHINKPAIKPLMTTTWNQDAPYNDLTPRVNGQATFTGCVATAVAQIMKYFNYPAKGVGEATCSDNSGAQHTASVAETFEWDKMLDHYSYGNYNADQGNAVAVLMKCCGYALRMGYGTEGSGTQSLYVPSALTEHFGYDAEAWLYSRNMFTLGAWEEMIYNNLATCGPVYYSGAAPNGGHAFVCDGYDSNGFFHFDWGWGGWCNGYFRLTALNPDGVGIGGFAGGYNYGQDVVLGIRPAREGSKKPRANLTCSNNVTATISGTGLDTRIDLHGGWFNCTPYKASYYITVAFTDLATGKVTYRNVNSSPWEVDLYYGWNDFGTVIPPSLTVGRYRVEVMTRNTAREQWQPCVYQKHITGSVIFTKSMSGSYSVECFDRARLTLDAAELLTPIYDGCPARVRFKATNNAEVEVPQHIAIGLGFFDEKGDRNIVAQGDSYLFALAPGESEEVIVTYNMHKQGGYELNKKYDVIVYDPDTRHIFATLKQIVLRSAPSPRLNCKNMKFNGNPYAGDRRALSFSLDVNCSEGYYAGRPVIALFTNGGGGSVTMGSFNEELILGAGQTEAATCTFAYMDAVTGNRYTAIPFYIKDGSWMQMDGNYVDFTMAELAGVEAAEADAQPLTVLYNRALRQAVVSGSSPIASVAVVTPSGAPVAAETAIEGNRAMVSLSMAPNGVVIVTATDAEGHSTSSKMVIY